MQRGYEALNLSYIIYVKEEKMKDKRNVHLKVQELCDCYATTDPLKGMSQLKSDLDKEEAALKWISFALLHGVNANAEKISLRVSDSGGVEVTAKYRKTELPSPGSDIGSRILASVRDITHIDAEKGKTSLALGIRDSSLDIKVKLEKENGGEKLTFQFP
jgi:hypothetical protein